MSTIDIVVLIAIVAHSIYAGKHPPKSKPDRSFAAGFIGTFLTDIIIYFAITFILGYFLAWNAYSSVLNIFKR